MNIGIIGDGQLGRMLALAGYPLGFHFGFLGQKDSPSGALGKVFSTIEELDAFADVITYESENTSLELIRELKTPLYPPQIALQTTQNRRLEKELFGELGIPCARFAIATTIEELRSAVAEIGTPAIIKTTTEGYDGKGQYTLKNANEIETAWQQLGGRELIVEAFVNFDYEVSAIATYGAQEVRYYPLTQNTHQEGILQTSEILENDDALFNEAQSYIDKIATAFDYRGTLTVEFFVKNGKLIANEIAPRVHNSGHWTIEGAGCSQFANHIRAITGLPLGLSDATYQHIMMHNIIGELPNTQEVLHNVNAHLHLYDKSPRPGRKLGHITICY